MDASLIIVAIVALAFGALIGWLLGSRGGEQGRATAESLRMQLDEVVKERDSNRAAVQELAAFRAAQAEREKAFEDKVAELTKAREEFPRSSPRLAESCSRVPRSSSWSAPTSAFASRKRAPAPTSRPCSSRSTKGCSVTRRR